MSDVSKSQEIKKMKKDAQDIYELVKGPKRNTFWALSSAIRSGEESIRSAIEKLKDTDRAPGIRIQLVLMMLDTEIGNKLAVFAAKKAIAEHSSGHPMLRNAIAKLHDYMDGKLFKDELKAVHTDMEAFHNRSVQKHMLGYADSYAPCADESISKMIMVICQNLLDEDERSCGFAASSMAVWVSSLAGQEAKDAAEQSHIDFLIRLLERPKLRVI